LLPLVAQQDITLPLAGHVFAFRRLTWKEEIGFAKTAVNPSRLDYAAFALGTVDGKHVTYQDSIRLLRGLPRPIQERVVIFYMGSLPKRRILDVEELYSAPEPAPYRERQAIEAEEVDPAEAEMLKRYGREEVGEAEALAQRMASAANYAGSSPATPDESTPVVPIIPPAAGSPEMDGDSVVYHFEVD